MEKYIPLQKKTVVHEQVITDSGSTQKRIRLSNENRLLAKMLLPIHLIATGVLFVIGMVGLIAMFGNGNSGAEAFGRAIGAFFIQVAVYILAVIFSLVQLINRGRKDKLANAFMVLTLVTAGIGLVVWSILAIVSLANNGYTSMGLWTLTAAIFNLTCIVISLIRKRK